jgi:superfamily II DNA helicase RecQ
LKDHFGFSEYRRGQLEVINALPGAGADLAVFPTDGEKSLCYQLQALALTKAKMSKHEFFGIFEEYRFSDVLR